MKVLYKIKELYWFIVFTIYSMLGYPRFFEKYNYGVNNIIGVLIVWLCYSLVIYICFKLIKTGGCEWIKKKEFAKSLIKVFFYQFSILGYLLNYEFTNNSIYVYLIPVYIIVSSSIIKHFKVRARRETWIIE